MTSASVYPASDITGDVTEYEFWIEISSLLPVNGYIIVIFPNKVSIIDTAAAEASCAAV